MLEFSWHRGVVRAIGALRVNIMAVIEVIAPSGSEYTASFERERNETYAR